MQKRILYVLLIALLVECGFVYYMVPKSNPIQEFPTASINAPSLVSDLEPTPNPPAMIVKTGEKFYAPILMYHHIYNPAKQNPYIVSPGIFAQQMEWLHAHDYHVISYHEFYDAIQNGPEHLPKNPVVITFDDGYKDQYVNALPILKKYNYSAVFYIPSGFIGKGNAYMTWDMLKDLVKSNMEIASHTVNHIELAKATSAQLISELTESKKVLEEKLGISIPYFAYPGGSYNNAVAKEVEKVGYDSAVTTYHYVYHLPQENPYEVPRIHIDNDMISFVQFILGKKM